MNKENKKIHQSYLYHWKVLFLPLHYWLWCIITRALFMFKIYSFLYVFGYPFLGNESTKGKLHIDTDTFLYEKYDLYYVTYCVMWKYIGNLVSYLLFHFRPKLFSSSPDIKPRISLFKTYCIRVVYHFEVKWIRHLVFWKTKFVWDWFICFESKFIWRVKNSDGNLLRKNL
jgi:hypothetical protein